MVGKCFGTTVLRVAPGTEVTWVNRDEIPTGWRAQDGRCATSRVAPGRARRGPVEEVSVRGQRGYWFEGSPHRLFFTDAQGHFVEDRCRLAGNTFVWEQDDITVRLESALSRDESVALAQELG